MDLVFDHGSADETRGHALIYFRDKRNPGSILASYVVVLPVSFELSKYVPPLLAARMPQMESGAIPFVPLPPVPETFGNYDELMRIAEIRGDDLVYGGEIDPAHVESVLQSLNQLANAYVELFQRRLSASAPTESELAVNDVLFSLMSEKDRLSELAKLTGKLRYAVDGDDRALMVETVREMESLARLLPEKYKAKALIRVAQTKDKKGGKLAELYLDRCYKISNEEYTTIERIDRDIRLLDSEA